MLYADFDRRLELSLPLEPNDLRLLGTMTALWSMLEATHDAHLALVAAHFQQPFARTFWKSGFTQRLRGWKELVKSCYNTRSSYRADAIDLADFILGIQDKRDRFTHSPWRAVRDNRDKKIATLNLGNANRKQMQWRVESKVIYELNEQIYYAGQQFAQIGPLYEAATKTLPHKSL